MKKDYLMEGTMADTADLVVLGAYYGTGKKGGLMSVFLLGCYDPKKDRWCTVYVTMTAWYFSHLIFSCSL